MNWPNRLTLLRVILIPFIVISLQLHADVLALVFFLLASFTDWMDGHLARKHGHVTNFGKFLDPVADKLLVLSTLIALTGLDRFPAWVCIIVLFRELAVDGLRLVAAQRGQVIAAGQLGKIKTTLQMTAIVVVLLNNAPFGSFPMDQVLIYLAVAMTIWSGVDYFIRNIAVIKQDV